MRKKKPGAQKELVKWAQVPFPEHIYIKSNRFPSFLGATITSFLGKNKKAAIWTALDSKYLKLRNIVVPDLAESKIPNAALWGLKKEFEFDQESIVILFAPERALIPGCPAGQGGFPVDIFQDVLQTISGITSGIQSAHNRAKAGARNHIYRDMVFL